MKSHQYAAASKGGNRSDMAIARAIRKHGWNSFTWKVIEICPTQEQLDSAECYWIERHNSISPHGYNVALGGRGRGSVSDETRRKIGDASRGRVTSDDTKEKLSALMKLRVRSVETARKIGQANLGRTASEATKERQSLAIKALAGSHMVAWTDERREKLAASKRGKKVSQETREKLSKIHSGESSPSAKLNWEQVVEIRRMCADKSMSQRVAAKLFGVSQSVIWNIVNLKTWKTNVAA
jgi:group I intron endonuclease